ncbi:hypothetical protein TNCV_4898981 [Trichonephila clavipes]|nr:hypothetical protein TNCV_4898981 [Trichonephila clavipes]
MLSLSLQGYHKTLSALLPPFLGLPDPQICLQSSIFGIILDGKLGISRVLTNWRSIKKTGSVANIPGRGRKEILSTTAKRMIIHSVKKEPRVSASKLALSMSSTIEEIISDETIRRTLHQYGFHDRTPIRKPLIK